MPRPCILIRFTALGRILLPQHPQALDRHTGNKERRKMSDNRMQSTPLFNFDLDKARLGVDNKRLSALICAILESQGGSVTIPADVASTVWENATLRYMEADNGDLMLILDGGNPESA